MSQRQCCAETQDYPGTFLAYKEPDVPESTSHVFACCQPIPSTVPVGLTDTGQGTQSPL
jgi:hypothetical protein